MRPQFLVGIDLGTTHCAISASPIDKPATAHMEIPQLVAPGEVAPRRLLPSFLYLPAEGELAEADTMLPWGARTPLVGEVARRLGAAVPGRLIASAKSWLVHGGVDRRAPILPWSAPDEAPHLSPAQASTLLLAHLREAWDQLHPDAPLAEQEVVVTVPASFDNVARELTVEAAREAGLPQVWLLEEPQAVFYDFLGTHRAALGNLLSEARLVLVVDVGGGTTDLTLVRVHPPSEQSPDTPQIERIAVGGHLMLGGDNMDATLAHYAQKQAGIEQLDPTEWAALVQEARRAKETLLSDDAPEQTVISLRRRGARLLGATKSVTLTRDAVERLLLDGFFPHVGSDETTTRRGRAGLTTLGLPYATDPAIPKHICTFLRRHVEAAREAGASIVSGLPRPDRILLNGGVFRAGMIVERLNEVLAGWYDGAPVEQLPHASLDIAVAQGATRYALARHGFGIAITGGAAHAYYIGIEGPDGARRALCIAPRGMEAGTTLAIREQVFGLILGQPVTFPLYSTTRDSADRAGSIIDLDDDLEPLPPIHTVLRAKGDVWKGESGAGVPVTLAATLTEGGALELYLVTVELPPRRWRLDFELRGQPPEPEPEPTDIPPSEPLPEGFERAQKLFRRTFSTSNKDPKQAEGLRRELENALGPRGSWSSTTCRALWDVGLACKAHRGRTEAHKLTWLRIMGWCLRPGFGAPDDAKRINALWGLHAAGLRYPSDKTNWTEWWVMWRRVAAGLSRAQQQALYEEVRPWLEGQNQNPPAYGKPEMVRMLASLESLSAEQKQSAGDLFLRHRKRVGSWWTLGRLGSRQPFHGDAKDVVSPEIAEKWLRLLLDLDWKNAEGAPFAAVLIAARTDDPNRDISKALRTVVLARLEKAGASRSQRRMVSEVVLLSGKDTRQVFGDSLPTGLRMTDY